MKKILISLFILVITFTALFGTNKIEVQASTIPTDEDLPTCYQQSDDRWGSTLYRNQTFAATGCGICSLTNVVNYLTGNFIEPTEAADYAYSIGAYNATSFSGTHQDYFYRQISCLEQKYGFKVVEGGTYFYNEPFNVSIKVLKDALKEGKGIIILVPGHFIALCDYNETTNSFLVYDCSAQPSIRGTYACGTWVTENEFKTVERLNIEWYGIFENNTHRRTTLDGFTNKKNGKAEVSYYINNPGVDNPYVSGTALDGRGIDYYFYTLDDINKEHYILSDTRSDIDTSGFSNVEMNKTGYHGVIDTKDLSAGTHYANIYARTKDGGLLTIAEVEMFISNSNHYDKTNKTFVIDMDNCIGQKDIHASWMDGGVNKACFVANYNVAINLGSLDLSKFSKAEIYYSSNSNFDANKDGVQSIIGFKKSRNSFGYHSIPIDLKNEIAHVDMTDGTSGGWSQFRVATIDLSSITYNGSVFLNGYNQEGQFYVVSKVVFYYKSNEIIPDIEYQTKTTDTVVTGVLENNTYYLGAYQLKNIQYLEVCYNSNVNGKVTLKGTTGVYDNRTINGSRIALLIHQNTCDELSIVSPSGASIKEVKLYMNTSDPFYVSGEENHQVLSYHDALGNPIYETESHASVTHHVEKTCTEDGIDTISCDYCEKIISGSIDAATGHEKKLTYLNEDSHAFICSNCNETISTENHKFDHYGSASTYHYLACECGARKEVANHTFDETGYCSVCKAECKHSSYSIIKGYEATCSSEGLSNGKKCKTCGKVFEEQEVIEPLDHEYEDGVCILCGEKQVAQPQETKTGCNSGFNILSSFAIIPVIGLGFGFRRIQIRKKEKEEIDK